ncbi:hypothetical protein BG011_003323, partial [Mortierella polycephala]
YHQQQQQHLQQQLQEYQQQRLHEQPHPQQQQQQQQQHHLHPRTSIPDPNLHIIIPPSLPQKPIIFTTSVGTALTTQAPVPFMTPPASAGSNAVLLNPFKTNNGSTSTVNLSLNNHATTSTCTQAQRDLQDSNSSRSNSDFRFSSVTGSESCSEASMDVVPSSQPPPAPPAPPKDIWPAQSLRHQNNFDVIGEREFVSMPLRRNSTATTGSGSVSTFSSLSSDIQTPISAPMAPCHHYTGGRGGGGTVPGGVDSLPGEISYQLPSQPTCPTAFTPTMGRFSYPALQKSRIKADKQKSVASVSEITSYCPHGSDSDNDTSSTSVTWTHKHANIIQEGTIPDRLWNEDDATTSVHTNDSPILEDFLIPPVQTNSSSIDLSGQKSIEKGYKGRCRETQGVDTMVHDYHPNRPSQRNGAAVFEGKTVVPRRILLSTQQFDSHLPFQGTIHLPQDPAAAYNPQCHQCRHDDLSRTSIHDPEYEKTMDNLSDPRGCLLDVEAQAQTQVKTEAEAEVETEGETGTEDWSLQEQQYHLAELQKRSYGHVQVPQSERTGGSGSSSGSSSGSGSGGEVQTNRRESKMSQYSTSRKSYLDDYRAQQKLLQLQLQLQ